MNAHFTTSSIRLTGVRPQCQLWLSAQRASKLIRQTSTPLFEMTDQRGHVLQYRFGQIGSVMPESLQTTFREFLDVIRVPAYLFDPESRHFVAANSTFCDLVGYPEPELITLEWPLIMADHGEVVRANQEIAGRQEDVFVANDFGFRRKDGTRVNTQIRYRVMRLVDGEATRQVYFAAVVSASRSKPH